MKASISIYFQFDPKEYEHIALDATNSNHLELCIYAASKHEEILQIIDSGAEPVFKPYNLTKFLELENDEKHVQMEIARKSFSDAQLDAFTNYVITEYRKQLKKYEFHQRVTIVANIARHICYCKLNL